MYFVYAIYNAKHNKIYIGQTENLEQRIGSHNDKTFKNSFTSRFDGDWVLIYEEPLKNRPAALNREKQLKSFRGREFIKIFVPR